ncbi:MAG: sigma-70 family RNA polymerase sigma factor [Bacteroidales bacterium]
MTAFTADIHKDLVVRSIEGERKAQYELYKLYSQAMFNICMRIMNNREEAEDMLQESFCRAFRQMNTFRFDSTIGAWLKKITVHTCINAINKRKAQLVYYENYEKLHVPDEPETTDEAELKMEANKIIKAMETLPQGCRIVFSLFMLEGYDHAEIAEILNVSESTSKTQLAYAKKRIREILTLKQ